MRTIYETHPLEAVEYWAGAGYVRPKYSLAREPLRIRNELDAGILRKVSHIEAGRAFVEVCKLGDALRVGIPWDCVEITQ